MATIKKRQVSSKKKRNPISNSSYTWNDDVRAYELVNIIRAGIRYKSFKIVANQLPFQDSDWSKILHLTSRTLERYKKEDKLFQPIQTERIIEIQQLMNYGLEVFEDKISFNTWLNSPNIVLGGSIPKDILDTTMGINMIKDALGRIEHGILA